MKKFLWGLLLTLGVLILLLAVFRKPLKSYLQGRIQERLVEYINTSPDRLYDYTVDTIEISVWHGHTILNGVRIMPRPGAMDSLVAARTGSLLEAQADSIALNGLGLYSLFFKGSINIDRILVADVKFKYLTNSAYVRPDSVIKKPFVLKDVFSDKLTLAFIKRVELRNIDVFTDDISTEEPYSMRFDSAQMVLKEIYTDEEVMKGAQPFTYKSLEMSAQNFVSKAVPGHTISVNAFSLNTAQKEIKLVGASFGPTKFDFKDSSKQFIRSVNAISASQVTLSGINFDSWQTDGRVEIRKVDVSGPDVRISMDHRWPKPIFERPFLQARVKSIPFPIEIDTIEARNGYIFYREIFDDGKPPLMLTFTEASAYFTNVTNDPVLLKTQPILSFAARAKFLDAGRLNVEVAFTMTDTMHPYHLTLSLDNMALSTLNPILEGQVHARMEGQLNKMAMNVFANRKGANGDFVFDYTGLRVSFFKEKQTKKGVKEKKNWLINTIVNPILRTDNHVSTDNFKGGNVAYVRPPDVSFFGMVWQCLKDGMVSTMVPGKGEEKKKDKAASKGKKETRPKAKK